MNPEASKLTHIDEQGEVRIVDISQKATTTRVAVAESWVEMKPETHRTLTEGNAPKGDVLATVRLAAIMASKKTSELVPLCHPLPLESVDCRIETGYSDRVRLVVSAKTSGKTGVEMEALTGASVAALTLYDMLKATDKSMTIGPTRLLSKEGGKSGVYRREEEKS